MFVRGVQPWQAQVLLTLHSPLRGTRWGGGGAGYSSWLLAWLNFLCSIRSDWGQNVNRRLGWPIKLWCSWESEGRGRREEEARDENYLCLCVIPTQTKCSDAYMSRLSLYIYFKQKYMLTFTHMHMHMNRHHDMQTHARSQPVKWVELTRSPSPR